MTIPVGNLYYMLCYAWRRLEEGELAAVDIDEGFDMLNLLCRVLASGVAFTLKRGLDRGFVKEVSSDSSPRGRIDFDSSLAQGSLMRHEVVNEYRVLSTDLLHNRILKETLRMLTGSLLVHEALREEMRHLHRQFSGVQPMQLTRACFRDVELTQYSRFYGFLIDVCEIIYNGMAIDQASGHLRFRLFGGDHDAMSRLFQSFVRNFLNHHSPPGTRVDAPHFRWSPATGTPEELAYLPRLETDVGVRSQGRLLVIDTKYYGEAFERRGGQDKIRSSHLMQIMSYLHNARASDAGPSIGGMLLYPTTTTDFRVRLTIQGFDVTVASLNLGRPWREVHDQLLGLVGWEGPGARFAA